MKIVIKRRELLFGAKESLSFGAENFVGICIKFIKEKYSGAFVNESMIDKLKNLYRVARAKFLNRSSVSI